MSLSDRGLTKKCVDLRIRHFSMTQAQAERRPGWNLARHYNCDGIMYDVMELRDESGQLQRFMQVEHYQEAIKSGEIK